LREGKGLASRLLSQWNVTVEGLRDELAARLPRGETFEPSIEIPFEATAKRVLQFAAEEADGLKHDHIGTEHLLLGILREHHTVAAETLMGHGLQIEAVRDEIVSLLLNSGGRHLPETLELRGLLARTLHAGQYRLDIPPDLDRTVSLVRERREADVYVLATLADRQPTPSTGSFDPRNPDVARFAARARGTSPAGREARANASDSFGPLSLSRVITPIVALVLEGMVGRPVIDESGLEGRYDIQVSGPHDSIERFAEALERETGLTLTRARREIEVVVVR
jgi:hypothetical protein